MRWFNYFFLILLVLVCIGIGCKKKPDNTNNNTPGATAPLVDTLVGNYKLSGIRKDFQNATPKDTIIISDTTLAVTKLNDSTLIFDGFTMGYSAAQSQSIGIKFFQDTSSIYTGFTQPEVWFNLPSPHDSIYFSCNYTLANGTGVYMNMSGIKTQ